MYEYYPENLWIEQWKAPIGEQIWEFLNEPSQISLLEHAADRGIAAVEGVNYALFMRFGAQTDGRPYDPHNTRTSWIRTCRPRTEDS